MTDLLRYVQDIFVDVLAFFVRKYPATALSWFLARVAMTIRNRNAIRELQLSKSIKIRCYFASRYEFNVWLQCEERDDLNLLPNLLGPGEVLVDGGANIGLWSLLGAEIVGPRGEVHSFEPNPSTFERLKNNVDESKMLWIRTNQMALGENLGFISFVCEYEHNNSRSVSAGTVGSIEVPVTSLDAYGKLRKCNLIKIDVEGLESEIIAGAMNTIREYLPRIIVEYNPMFVGSHRLEDWRVHKLLTELDYSAQLVSDFGTSTYLRSDWTTKRYCNLVYVNNR